MKITIDTSQDSKEDIRNAIKLLASIVGDNVLHVTNQGIETNGTIEHKDANNAFSSMFGDIAPTQPAMESKEDEYIEVVKDESPDLVQMFSAPIFDTPEKKIEHQDLHVQKKGKLPPFEIVEF